MYETYNSQPPAASLKPQAFMNYQTYPPSIIASDSYYRPSSSNYYTTEILNDNITTSLNGSRKESTEDENINNNPQEDLDMIANLIAKDSLYIKPDMRSQNAKLENHQLFGHPSGSSIINGTLQSTSSISTGDDDRDSSSTSSNSSSSEMHTVHPNNSAPMHHLGHHGQPQPMPGNSQQPPGGPPQPQSSQAHAPPPQGQQPPQGLPPNGIFHGMYHPSFDMSNIFGMSQLNGHVVPQMTISFGGAPTMVQHIPTHVQIPLPPSTSTATSNGASTIPTASTTTPNRQNGNSTTTNGTTPSSSSRSRNRTSGDHGMIKCNFCPKKISANAVESHRSECRMIRCHECPQCGKRFKARGGLQQHSRIHLNERAYGCKFCPKRFTQKSHLDQHERIHTGAKPFVCQYCGRGFRQRSQQIGHEATHPAGSIATAATSNSLNSTNSSGIFSTGSDSMSDNSCDPSPASSTAPMHSQSDPEKMIQVAMAQNNVVMLNMLNGAPPNNSQLINLKI